MTLYKIVFENRNNGIWSVFNANTLEPLTIDGFNPKDHKLFSDDIFTFNNNKNKNNNKDEVEIIHSSTRSNENIPAVLILDDNKTYGRDTGNRQTQLQKGKKPNSGRLLYKCIPDDISIPVFIVPYEIKQMGFSKVFTNIYVTIRYKQWDDKHPHANISQTIGNVDILNNFYEYQLYCKSLNNSIQKFNKDTNKSINNNDNEHDTFITAICNKYPQIEDRTSWKTFTIDPATSLDYDDGFSIKQLNDKQTLLSIYIANVTIWMDMLNLWTSFSKRTSTIYLPDRKRPMLPTILSDCLCSLQQSKRRIAFVMDIVLDEHNTIVSISYSNVVIRVFKNYSYEESLLLIDANYQLIFDTTNKMSNKYKYIDYIKDSHDVVCYLMIFMNYHSAQELLKSHNGVFRSTIVNPQQSLPDDLPEDVNKSIKIWNSSSASAHYIDINSIPITDTDLDKFTRHETLELDSYVHITSPIRRIVDLLNMIKIQQNKSLITLSNDAYQFYDKWVGEIEYINSSMKSIRKVQNDCSLLDTCYNNPETLYKTYDGYCFDKSVNNDGLYKFMVFLPELRLTSRITIRENLENYEKRQFKLYLFNNEEKFKRKIRLQIV